MSRTYAEEWDELERRVAGIPGWLGYFMLWRVRRGRRKAYRKMEKYRDEALERYWNS